jgi:anti-sigma B factor antagonist
MADDNPVFLVNTHADPVIVRINGRANYLNTGPLREFFSTMIAQGRTHIAVDFRNCLSVDSTFLGIVAGAALELADFDPPGEMVLSSLGPRNMEVVRNLGLGKIATVVDALEIEKPGEGEKSLGADRIDKDERVRMIVEAHKKLIKCDESNAERFQDVIAFMQKRSGWDRD